jgi:hypothetical protein
MIGPPIPDDEARRLALLKACNIIYTPAEEAPARGSTLDLQ